MENFSGRQSKAVDNSKLCEPEQGAGSTLLGLRALHSQFKALKLTV